MASNYKQIVAPTYLAASATLLYTVTAKNTVIREISINNIDSAARTFTIAIGNPSTPSNILFDTVTIQAVGAEPLNYSRATVLKTGDTIYALADVANKVSIMISGMEIT